MSLQKWSQNRKNKIVTLYREQKIVVLVHWKLVSSVLNHYFSRSLTTVNGAVSQHLSTNFTPRVHTCKVEVQRLPSLM